MFNNGFLKWNWASAISAIVIAAAATATATPPASASFIEDMRRNCPCFNPGRIAATRGHLQFALLSHSCHNLWLFYLHTYFNFHVHLYFHRRSCHRVLGVPNPCNLLGSWQTNILSTWLFSFSASEELGTYPQSGYFLVKTYNADYFWQVQKSALYEDPL